MQKSGLMENCSTTAAAISAAAQARALLGQAAHHELMPDGWHRVTIYDRAALKLRVGVGATVAEAVRQVRQQGGQT
jgi:hypothetical protein